MEVYLKFRGHSLQVNLWMFRSYRPSIPALVAVNKIDENLEVTEKSFNFAAKETIPIYSSRGGRPATIISSPSHILLIFSSEPSRNPRPSIIMCLKVSNSLR